VPRAAWLALGAAAGALGLGLLPDVVVAMLGIALGCAAVAARSLGRERSTQLVACAIGVAAIGLRGAMTADALVPLEPPPVGDGPWVAVVQSVGASRAAVRPAIVRLEAKPPVLVAASLPWYPAVVPSDRIALSGRIRPPPDDDYGAYLARIGAVGTLRAETLKLLPPDDSVAGALERLRRGAAGGLERSMPEPEAGLAAGVLIGLRDRVDRDVAAAFTAAGASHVVAISGWNIAIVASTLAALAGGLRRRRRAVLTAAAIAVYVAFVGPSPSVVRAGAMAGVALLARELGRPGTAAAALGWALTALLLLDPAWVDDVGFRLSVLATAGIVAWSASLTRRLAGEAPGRPRRWLADVLGVSLAAQAATTPIVLLEFGRLSLVAPAVNLVVVPLVPPAMAAGALALVVGVLSTVGLPDVLATLVGLPAWALYAAMVWVVRVGAGAPLSTVELGPPWDVVAAATSAAALAAGARWGTAWLEALRVLIWRRPCDRARPSLVRRERETRSSKATRGVAAVLLAATIGLILAVVNRPDGTARVVVLDVGQGDGILVEGGRGGRMVVDGGPDPGRLLVALDERLPPWDRRIDMLVLTHPHEDHVAGLALMLERYRVGRVYEPGMTGPGPGYRAWEQALADHGVLHYRLATGDRLSLDQIAFHVLWPDPNRVPERPSDGGTSINNVSIVLLGEVGGQRLLLAGDIEEGVDPELVARGLPPVDLLKVAHHGSRTASTSAFLGAVSAKVAVVSAGLGNPYGHPAPSTIQRLRELAGRTYRTDTDGTVEVSFDRASLRVRTSGPRSTPRSTPRTTAPAAGAAVASTAGRRAGLAAFACGIPERRQPPEPPVAPEAPPMPRLALGGPRAEAGAGTRRVLERPPRVRRPEWALGYHRPDADLAGAGDRVGPRDRSPRLLLGRRRVRPRGCPRGLPQRPSTLPRRPARALATGDRAHRGRPPPG
jgi:competence protein ComEC